MFRSNVIARRCVGRRNHSPNAADTKTANTSPRPRSSRSAKGDDLGRAGPEGLKELRQLRSLDLSGSSVLDEELKELKELKQLISLDLNGCPCVTGIGLKHLIGLPKLASLSLEDTKVTDDGMKELKK